MYKITRTSETEVTEFEARYETKLLAAVTVEIFKKLDEEYSETATYKIEKC